MSKILKVFKDPLYAIQKLKKLFKRLFTLKYFIFSADSRSDSENGLYASAVSQSLKNQKKFDNFKRNPEYYEILEHVTEAKGLEYLQILQGRDDSYLERAIDTLLKDDQIGNPRKYYYPDFNIPLSPTTLRYLKVASDINYLFGNSFNKIAEIGCGYGGQCHVNDHLLEVKHAVLFDLPVVNKLIDRYLNSFIFNGSYSTSTINKTIQANYDLVISNYAWSELPKKLQLKYIEKIMLNSNMGYLTMNSGQGGESGAVKLNLSELKDNLPNFEIFEERPSTGPYNYIICWGHKEGKSL